MCYRLPNAMHTICSDRRCSMAIKLSYILPFIICSPTFLVFEILETKVVENGGISTLYHLDLSPLARVNHELFYMVHLWTYAVIIKLLPCLILTVVTISLVSKTYQYVFCVKFISGRPFFCEMDVQFGILVRVVNYLPGKKNPISYIA